MSIFLNESKDPKKPDNSQLIEGMYPSLMIMYNGIIKEKQPSKAKVSATFNKIEKIIKERKSQAKSPNDKKNWENAIKKFTAFFTNVMKEGRMVDDEKKSKMKSEYEIRGNSKYPPVLEEAIKKHYDFLNGLKNEK